MTDSAAMARAIEIARGGFPAPNPHVGCVVVRDGEVVGEGFHDHAGGPHAEAVALDHAGDRARAADVFVTLEPCNHKGRTPPCSLALIEAGVRRVVIAVPDPNPRAVGGTARLKEAGIMVESGLMEAEARAANWQFLRAHELKRPVVVLKVAMTLDGRVALPSGESKWITSPESREEGHRLRAECGAVLAGRGTIEADNPLLTARILGVVNPPLRVVLDPHRKLSGTERVFGPEAPTIRVVADSSDAGDLCVPLEPAGGFELAALLKSLWELNVTGVLVEGGPTTIGSFLRTGLWDRLVMFVAAKILGEGKPWVAGLAATELAQVAEHRVVDVRHFGPDVCLSIEPARNEPVDLTS